MIRNKKIILSILFLAWAIIFAHSVIPHHHHVEKFYSDRSHSHDHHNDCHHSHNHDDDLNNEQVHKCNHDRHEHVCHFHVDVLTGISIDKTFIANNESTFFSYPITEKSDNFTFHTKIVFEQLPKTNHLRGPPSIG